MASVEDTVEPNERLPCRGVLFLTFRFSKHDMSKEKTSFGQSDIVRLSDEDAAVELLERAVTGACGTLLTS